MTALGNLSAFKGVYALGIDLDGLPKGESTSQHVGRATKRCCTTYMPTIDDTPILRNSLQLHKC
jgi:hypothetical protein